MTKSNKENGKLNWSKQNKMRQTMITQDGNEQPSWRMTKTCTGQFPQGGSPKRRGIWIIWSLGQGQTAKRGIQGTVRFRRLGWGWGLNGFGDEHKSWTILNRWQKVAMSRRLDNRGRSDLERRSSWDAFQDWRTKPAGKPLTWFKAVVKGFIYLFIYLFTHLAKNNKIITKVRHYINKI